MIWAVPALAGLLDLDPTVRPVPEGSFRPASACDDCHDDIVRDWSRSRHRAAWTNDLLFEGYVREPLPMCVTCHAPLAEQVAEIEDNAAFYAARGRGPIVPGTELLPEPKAAEGVTCAVCHWRSGRIVAAADPVGHPDALVEERLGEVCRSCHEFGFALHGAATDEPRPTADPMQATWSEWVAYREAGGAGTCVSCHLPDGRHLFRGAHDRAFLAGSLSVQRVDGALVLASVGVGHALPTGDLFRHLTVEAQRDDGSWAVVARIGRTFRTAWDPVLGGVHKGLVDDTRLLPGERRVVPVPGRPWRVRYHYGSEEDEEMGALALDEIVVTLAAGG